jgi:hypothetical protein
MPPPKKQSSLEKVTGNQRILQLVKTPGVTVLLDTYPTVSEAQLGTEYSYDPDLKFLRIITSVLEQKDKPFLLEIIRLIHDADNLIWKASKQEVLNSFKEYSSHNEDSTTLEFFSKILSADDFSALKLSLYLRSQLAVHKNKDIRVYKEDIRDRFGERGNNIANLCTAGYFEMEFMPLYNEVTEEEFYKYYEIAVGKRARALFVNSGMDVADIEKAFEETLAKAIRYYMSEFRIHGKGNVNVSNIKKFFSSKPATEARYIIQKAYDDPKLAAIEYAIKIIRK